MGRIGCSSFSGTRFGHMGQKVDMGGMEGS
jgi:hypothetical protein